MNTTGTGGADQGREGGRRGGRGLLNCWLLGEEVKGKVEATQCVVLTNQPPAHTMHSRL